MNEDQREEALVNQFRNGQDAQKLMNGIENLLLMYKGELMAELTSSGDEEKERRESIYRQLKTIDYVESKLLTAIQTGKLAKQDLTAMDKAKQLINNMIG